MKIKELLKKLEGHDPELEVMIKEIRRSHFIRPIYVECDDICLDVGALYDSQPKENKHYLVIEGKGL